MSEWKATFTKGGPEQVPLGLTIDKPGQGVTGWALFLAGRYPACSEHGAMNRVASHQMWRCLNCNIGCEIDAS